MENFKHRNLVAVALTILTLVVSLVISAYLPFTIPREIAPSVVAISIGLLIAAAIIRVYLAFKAQKQETITV